MKTLNHIRCPGCDGAMVPTELRCEACDVTVRGHFAASEFATLGEEDLHFLRIFVLCEGRIREMESALGVSYPTIKLRLAQLKERLAGGAARVEEVREEGTEGATAEVLRLLERGKIGFEKAMERIRELRGR